MRPSRYLHTISHDPNGTDGAIELRVPARFASASTVRLVAAALAADAGFTVEDVEDVRLAINEVFTCAVAGNGDREGTVVVRCDVRTSELVVELSVADGVAPIELDDLAGSILRSAVDEVRIEDRLVALTKYRRPSQLDDR